MECFFVFGVIIIPCILVVNFNELSQIAKVFPILPSAENNISSFCKNHIFPLVPIDDVLPTKPKFDMSRNN